MGERFGRVRSALLKSGIWCVETWLYFVVSFVKAPYGLSWQAPYLVCMVVAFSLAGLAAYLGKRPDMFAKYDGVLTRFDDTMAVLAVIGTLLFGLHTSVGFIPAPVALVGLVLSGLYAGGQFVRWAVLYSGMNVEHVTVIVFLQSIVSTCVAAIMSVVTPWFAVVLASLLPACSALLLRANKREEPFPESNVGIFSTASLLGMWRIWGVILGTALIMGVVGNQSITCFSMPPVTLFVLQKVALVLFDVCLLVWVLRSKTFMGFTTLWRIVMITVGILLVVISTDPSNFIFEIITTTFYSILHIFLLLSICTIVGRARLSEASSYVAMGLVFGGYFAMLVLAAPLSDGLFFSLLGAETFSECVPYLFMVLVLIAASSWGANDYAMRALTEDSVDVVEVDSAKRAIEAVGVCELVSRDYGLTRRESEILGLLYMGRTRTYIAESLFISENTVKTHASNIYDKLGVHNKKDLQVMLSNYQPVE